MNMKVWAFLTIFASTAMFANAEEGGAEVSDETSLLKQSPSSGLVMAGSDGGAVMRCQYNKTKHSAESDPIEWFFENDDGSEEPLDEEFISITENGASLITVPSAEAKQGTYLCRTNGATGRFTVQYFFKLEKVPRSTIVIQGDDLLLMCNLRQGVKIEGADVKFTWYTKPGDVEDPETVEGTELIPNTTSINDIEPHIKIIDRANNSVVKIEDAVYSDRAWYMCKVTNSHGQEAVMETLVRVKDKYAAVYPFIGILAEVIVLCFIIFICERRKTKSDEVEEEEEYNGNAAGGAGSSSLRRRN